MNNIVKNINSLLPTYSTELPFSKETVFFTPFKVKDAKNIAIILQEENKILALKALNELLKTCCQELDPKELCLADAEYLFLMIRSKSVEENLNLLVKSKPVQINVFDIKSRNGIVKTDIKISAGLTLKIETPKLGQLLKLTEFNSKNFLLASVKQIVSSQEIYNVDTFVPKEMEELLNNLPLNILTQLERIQHPELYLNLNTEDGESEVSGNLTFFTLR